MTTARPFETDTRVVLTLDAGGTSFRFSAIAGNREVASGVTLPSRADDLAACLAQIVEGFSRVRDEAGDAVAALSFAFPGPADYSAGVIGDLGNLPAFRGGVALGPMLEDRFGVPVFINNDGDLFAYGEALHGLLPEVNRLLAEAGSPRRYRNLLGVTLGTGFGGGIVRDGELFVGDNGAAGEIWLVRNKLDRGCPAEEGVGIRAVRNAYARRAGIAPDAAPEPSEIAAIARGESLGDDLRRPGRPSAGWERSPATRSPTPSLSSTDSSLSAEVSPGRRSCFCPRSSGSSTALWSTSRERRCPVSSFRPSTWRTKTSGCVSFPAARARSPFRARTGRFSTNRKSARVWASRASERAAR